MLPSPEIKPLPDRLQTYAQLQKRMAVQKKMQLNETVQGTGFENKKLMHRLLKGGLKYCGLANRGLENILRLQVKERSIALGRLPKDLDGLRILHISDTHADGVPGLAAKLNEILPSLKYDLCILTGDFRFGKRGFHPDSMNATLEFLKSISCEYGSYAVLGNHDFIEEVAYLEEAGVRCLFNEALPLAGHDKAWLLGVDDPHLYQCDDLSLATKGIPEEDFKLLAVHSPEIVEEAAEKGVDLYLCGHTHGGQICLPFIGAVFSNARCSRKHAFDIFEEGAMQGYTHNGTGASSVAARFLSPSEVVIHTLRSVK